MRSSFFLFQSHLDLTHTYWSQLVQPGDWVIDATCGNGHDTLKLCQLALTSPQGRVYGLDIQSPALLKTEQLLLTHGFKHDHQKIILENKCHSTLPAEIQPEQIKLIVYNLGYLPGANKEQTTKVSTTLQSLEQAQALLMPGGAISLTCYPGHLEGAYEQQALIDLVKQWSPQQWSCCHHQWLNRQAAPTVLLLQKSMKDQIPPPYDNIKLNGPLR